MPTYDYECENCEHTFEIFQSFSEPQKKKCPACSKYKLYKVISEPIIIIKGVPSTLGQLAEKNSKRLGKNKIQEAAAKKENSKPKEPWYVKEGNASRREIQNMTREQKAQYIKKGKKT